jgi:sporulation integral membrane protein YtvI
MKEFYKENRMYVDKVIFLLLFFAFSYIFITYILFYIGPFVAGFLISLIISPLVGFLQRKLRIARSVTTIFLIIVIILLVAIAASSLFNQIVKEAAYLSETLEPTVEELRKLFNDLESRFENFMSFMPDEFYIDFNEMVNQILAILTSILGDFTMRISVGLVTGIPMLVLNMFICLISAFFFTKDKKLISESINKSLPEWLKTRLHTIQKGLLSAIGGYIRAQLTRMSVIAAVSILGLAILGYPYAVIIGIVIALFDSLPMIGTGIVLWPWAAISLLSGNYAFALGLILINVTCFVARQLLEPKVLGQQIGLHPLLVLAGIYVGLQVFGVFGLFLGPVLLVIAKLILKTKSEAV